MKTCILLLIGISAIFANPTIRDFSTSNKFFSATVYKKISKARQGNFLVSPLSIEIILALTKSGSRGSTAEEIQTCLNFTKNQTTLESTFQNLLKSFNSQHYTLRTANKIYVKDGFHINDDFRTVAELLGSESENIDFGRRHKAAHVINSWVGKRTDEKIRDLIDPSNLHERTRVVLVNALYFKANWSRPFPIAYNKKLDFHLSKSEKTQTEMMLLHEKRFNYFESQSLRATFFELPFTGGDSSMVIVLPDQVDGLPLLENQIRKVLKPHKFTSRSVNVALPRFRVESTIDFRKILRNMGVGEIFDQNSADLSGIAGKKGDLVVDRISQKTFIDVSEEGVEGAAAVYTLIAVPMSAPAQAPKNFRVDRPFIFYVKVNDVIVFVGRVTDPR